MQVNLKIGIVCHPTYGGSGVVATELGVALSNLNHEVHFISYDQFCHQSNRIKLPRVYCA